MMYNLYKFVPLFFIPKLLQAALVEGCRLPVRMQGGNDWPLAEIISIKEIRGQRGYYVHYVDCKLFSI